VTLSEIFLSSAGKNEAEVKARANALVVQVRAGGDFAALATTNSEREVNGVRIAQQNKGKVGTFEVPSLREDIAAAVKDVKVGGVSEPLRSNDGYQILRVDERTTAGTSATFNENRVREAITMERTDKAREEYLQNLRNEAYIKVAVSYRAAVLPLLKIKEEVIAEGGLNDPKPEEKKKKGRFLGIFPKP
jgi:parvulin-like peptidyl-prolyl isomerase